nr:hypothetical protein OH820_15445 [Streptomyces sp. NBC_00857]
MTADASYGPRGRDSPRGQYQARRGKSVPFEKPVLCEVRVPYEV